MFFRALQLWLRLLPLLITPLALLHFLADCVPFGPLSQMASELQCPQQQGSECRVEFNCYKTTTTKNTHIHPYGAMRCGFVLVSRAALSNTLNGQRNSSHTYRRHPHLLSFLRRWMPNKWIDGQSFLSHAFISFVCLASDLIHRRTWTFLDYSC